MISDEAGGRAVSFSGEGKVRGIALRTLAPARIGMGPGKLDARLDLAAGGGRATIHFDRRGERIAARATLSGLELKLINEDLVGRFDADLDLPAGAPV